MATRNEVLTAVGGESPTNGGLETVQAAIPYVAEADLEGVADILFHRWNVESVAAKGAAAKGSKTKKTDDTESYLYRNEAGEICLPGEYVRMAILGASRFRQDPRSPRKSALDLYKAAVFSVTDLASLGKSRPDYEDRRRVTVQRNGITRCRPAILKGWRCTVRLMCNLPEYVSSDQLNETLQMAGRLIGVGDFRPTYGRFIVTGFRVGLE